LKQREQHAYQLECDNSALYRRFLQLLPAQNRFIVLMMFRLATSEAFEFYCTDYNHKHAKLQIFKEINICGRLFDGYILQIQIAALIFAK